MFAETPGSALRRNGQPHFAHGDLRRILCGLAHDLSLSRRASVVCRCATHFQQFRDRFGNHLQRPGFRVALAPAAGERRAAHGKAFIAFEMAIGCESSIQADLRRFQRRFRDCEMAASLGLEPRQNDSESFVLPLHHEAKAEAETRRRVCVVKHFLGK